MAAAVAKAYGCTVVVSELSELRRKKALDAGVADHAIDPTAADLKDEVLKITGGTGADAAFEAAAERDAEGFALIQPLRAQVLVPLR